MRRARIIVADVLDGLAQLKDGSAHCCVTSPPYWGLRDYGEAGQIGLEETPEEYVARLVEVFREVRRVLRPDATLWLNIADSYAANRSYQVSDSKHPAHDFGGSNAQRTPPGLKPGDMVGIPWRVAFALQADGWWLRSAPVWAKPNPMPESVSGWRWERCRVKVRSLRGTDSGPTRERRDGGADCGASPWNEYRPCPGCAKCEASDGLVFRRGSWRPTSSYEYVFLLAPRADYFCDQEAVREASEPSSVEHGRRFGNLPAIAPKGNPNRQDDGGARTGRQCGVAAGSPTRNPRDVWTITTRPFPGAHFAVFPPELPERCIRAGTAERTCAECGAPWAPVVERKYKHHEKWFGAEALKQRNDRGAQGAGYRQLVSSATTGHRPTCACDADHAPATVLDPFTGAGTTGLVALRLGRNFVGVELSRSYAEMAAERIRGDAPLLNEVALEAADEEGAA